MTTTSITLHVPQAPRDEWAALDDPGLSRRQRAASASTVLASAPPAALAKRARHRRLKIRRPNRGGRSAAIRASLALAFLLAAIFGSIAHAAPRNQAPAFYGLTPSQVSQAATALEAPAYQLTAGTVTANGEAHACHAVLMFSRIAARDELASGPAWHEAWDASAHADPEMRTDIRRYLDTGHGWSRIYGTNGDCTPDA